VTTELHRVAVELEVVAQHASAPDRVGDGVGTKGHALAARSAGEEIPERTS